MADFQQAFAFMIPHEDFSGKGEVTPEPKGGKARYGINSIAHPDLEKMGFYTMPADQALVIAKGVYAVWYWRPIQGDMLSNQTIANKIFDMGVDMYWMRSVGLAQRSLNLLSKKPSTQWLEEDGVVGPVTRIAINDVDTDSFMTLYKQLLANYYKELVANDPADSEYLSGWLARAAA